MGRQRRGRGGARRRGELARGFPLCSCCFQLKRCTVSTRVGGRLSCSVDASWPPGGDSAGSKHLELFFSNTVLFYTVRPVCQTFHKGQDATLRRFVVRSEEETRWSQKSLSQSESFPDDANSSDYSFKAHLSPLRLH